MKSSKKQRSETAEIARDFRVTPRCVRGWRAAGAPLRNKARLSRWLASRKHVPTPKAGNKQPVEYPPASGPLGAPAALRRLESAEADAYARLERAIADGDAVSIRLARDGWLKFSESLRKFDLLVAEHRRTSGELIEKTKVEEGLRILGMALRMSSQECLPAIASEILSAGNDQIRIRNLIRKSFYTTAVLSFAAGHALNIPAWMLEAVSRDACDNLTNTSFEQIKGLADVLKELARIGCQTVIKDEEKAPPEPPEKPAAAATVGTS
jgi:hypothetical protein